LSNVFYAVKLKIDHIDYYKALCCWLNSTIGLLLILSNREDTEGGWRRLKISHWRLQKVIDLSKLNAETITKLSKTFDSLCTKEMPTLPQQYQTNNISRSRKELDKEVFESLGIYLSEKEINELYRLVYKSFDQWLEISS
jgi:hypothetical protein